MKLQLYVDGASRENPGHASYGVVILDESGKTLSEIGEYIGTNTNNVAEYRALIRGLEEALKLKSQEVSVFTDSQLVARQFAGIYRIKDANLQKLMLQVRALQKSFRSLTVEHIPRSSHPGNVRADKLANIALDQRLLKS